MLRFQLVNAETAPEASVDTIKAVNAAYGFLPNLIATLGNSPAAVQAYASVSGAFEGSSLSPVEQQVVLLTTSVENECHYCVAAHTAVAQMVGASGDVVSALRAGESLADPRLEALRALTLSIVRNRGWVSQPEIQGFIDAGFAKEQVLDVVTGVTQKTLSNYANHLAETPLDDNFAPFAWTPNREGATAGVS